MATAEKGQTPTETIIAALRVLARDIQSGDGVANAAINQAADRMEQMLHAQHSIDAEHKVHAIALEMLANDMASESVADYLKASQVVAEAAIAVRQNAMLLSTAKRYEKALNDIVKHQEIIGGRMGRVSATYFIATKALSGESKDENGISKED